MGFSSVMLWRRRRAPERAPRRGPKAASVEYDSRVSSADVARCLLDHLRAELREPTLEFVEPPAPIRGGYDTQIFAFRLTSGAPPPFSGRLILRLLGTQHAPTRVFRERAVQNALVALGYPAPRVLAACADPAPLGGPFLVMERMPGRPMLEVRKWDIASVLVQTQLRLHDLDGEILRRAVGQEACGDMPSFGSVLAELSRRVAGRPIEGLARAMQWLHERRPPEPSRPVICHGDFHPQNILMAGGVVTGVLDWPNAVLADHAYDVAATRTILSCTPIEMVTAPTLLRWLARVSRPILIARYLVGYQRHRRLDPATLAYYEAASCMRGLVRVAEARLSSVEHSEALNPLDASSFGERLAARFAELAGVVPGLRK
jgi:aminoglycoside phosphotransferase (APT) family kinase protein